MPFERVCTIAPKENGYTQLQAAAPENKRTAAAKMSTNRKQLDAMVMDTIETPEINREKHRGMMG